MGGYATSPQTRRLRSFRAIEVKRTARRGSVQLTQLGHGLPIFNSVASNEIPVAFPRDELELGTIPAPTGSPTKRKTIGTVVVAFRAATAPGVVYAIIASSCRRANSTVPNNVRARRVEGKVAPGTCGSPLYWESEGFPEYIAVALGKSPTRISPLRPSRCGRSHATPGPCYPTRRPNAWRSKGDKNNRQSSASCRSALCHGRSWPGSN